MEVRIRKGKVEWQDERQVGWDVLKDGNQLVIPDYWWKDEEPRFSKFEGRESPWIVLEGE